MPGLRPICTPPRRARWAVGLLVPTLAACTPSLPPGAPGAARPEANAAVRVEPAPSPVVARDAGRDVVESDTSAEAWVEATLQALSVRQKIAQLVIPWVGGEYLSVDSEDFERLRDWVAREEIGGIIISIGAPLELAAKLNLLQEMARIPLLVTADVEHGPGQRLYGGVVMPYGLDMGGGTQFPPVMALGAANDETLAYEMGRITAVEGRAVGIHLAFAPVADVNNNPANPIINVRSYGEDPARVGALAAAHVRGLQEHGMLATAKHFPGHGNTGRDSHLELPVITATRAGVDSIELVPFRATIAAGVAAVMSAHIAFPELTGDSLPATLSSRVLTELLQEELGFDGIIFTDALYMGAIVRNYGGPQAAVRAIRAGADVLLMPADVGEMIDGVTAAVELGELPVERLDHSVRKLLRAKAGLGLHRERTVELAKVPERVGTRAHRQWARRAAERSITLARDDERRLPIRGAPVPRLLSIVYADDPDPLAGSVLHRELLRRSPRARTAILGRNAHAAELDSLLLLADSADVVLFSPFVRVLAHKGDVAIAEPVAEFVRRVARRRPTVVTSFGNPYVLAQFPELGTYVLAWGQEPVIQEAVVRAWYGEIPVEGRLPISIPPFLERGAGIRLDPVRATTSGVGGEQ